MLIPYLYSKAGSRSILTKAVEKGNIEVAKIHAENIVQKNNESLNMQHTSARVDAVASRVQTAARTKRMTSSMQGVVIEMGLATKSMNLEKITCLFNNSEKLFENQDVYLNILDGSMSQKTVTSVFFKMRLKLL